MAKIGIDARLWGVKHGGIGRYTEELVKNLQEIDKKNNYALFCRRQDLDKIPVKENWKKVAADVRHYSLKEQTTLPGIFSREKLDLLHVPHFNAPIFYKGKLIVTIHDILWHQFRGPGVTTLPAPLYLIKYLGYRIVTNSAIWRAVQVITPTKAVKNEIVNQFRIPEEKVTVTYEGAPTRFNISIYESKDILVKYKIQKPYLLYVGNLYPHKNVERLVQAIKQVRQRQSIELVIVCGRDVFWKKFTNFLEKEKAAEFVSLVGSVPDQELAALYKSAEAFVFPTLSEGFGLPGIEAMSFGTPVVCSGIAVLREVYGGAAVYFHPKDTHDIADKIIQILNDSKLRAELINKGKQQVKKYSWREMAKETLEIYEKAATSGQN